VSLVVSTRLAAIPHYEPGLTTAEVLARYGLDAAVKLASNESPFPPLPGVEEVVRDGVATLNRYPDGAARALRADLADLHGVAPEGIVLGNGSCELILLAGEALLDPGTTVVHPDPSFALYPHLAAATGARAVPVPLDPEGRNDLDAMAAAVDETTRLVVVCTPNNPTGGHLGADDLERFLDAVPPDVAVLVDEAYHDFVTAADRGRALSMARRRPNLLVLRTFSKAFGLCGLRVGYGVGSPDWIGALDRVRQPFNVNALAQAAARASLRQLGELDRRVRSLVAERTRVEDALRMWGVPFTPSQANFILVRPAEEPGHGEGPLHERLLRRGVIVRDGRALGVPGALRVSIGTPSENDAFLAALADALGRPGPTDTPHPLHAGEREGRTRP